MRTCYPFLARRVAAAAVLVLGSTALHGRAAAEHIGTVSQPLVAGTLVPIERQRQLGLVTVYAADAQSIASCSGTLVNRYWVLTADHCVTTDGTIGGPARAPSALWVTAAWSAGRSVAASGLVRYTGATAAVAGAPTDAALLYLGLGDLGETPVQLFYVQPVDVNTAFQAYGRGLSSYAVANGPTVKPPAFDGLYRTATLVVATTTPASYSYRPNRAGQIISSGDSGSADFVLAPNGALLGIAGVHSTCTELAYAPNQPATPGFETSIGLCTSAALAPIRDDIVRRVQAHAGLLLRRRSAGTSLRWR